MRTNLIAGTMAAVAWLERDKPGEEPERIELAKFPFTLGRNEACDYPVHSSRVSREHAELIRRGTTFAVRDLKSTNGTLVNGERVDEQRLVDGDLLVVADVHFTFRTSRQEQARKTVTQVMDADQEQDPDANAGSDLIHAVRRLQETLLYRAARNRFQPIFDLHKNCCAGYEAIPRRERFGEATTARQMLEATDCRLTERLAQLRRMIAAEHMAKIADVKLLFVRLKPAEVGADSLPPSLVQLATLSGGKGIVAQIPDSAVVDIPYFRDFRAKLRELGISVAFDGFTGSAHQIKGLAEFAPDYLKLSPAVARGVDKSSQRQEQIRALAGAANELQIQLIAVDVHTESESRTCHDIGCRLAQGDHFGRAQTIDWPVEDVGPLT